MAAAVAEMRVLVLLVGVDVGGAGVDAAEAVKSVRQLPATRLVPLKLVRSELWVAVVLRLAKALLMFPEALQPKRWTRVTAPVPARDWKGNHLKWHQRFLEQTVG